jgi:hypothetical protein
MMVPDMPGVLIETVREAAGEIQSAYDPFVGSGTTLTESMLRGMDFTGWDINPLAVPICRVKAGSLQPRDAAEGPAIDDRCVPACYPAARRPTVVRRHTGGVGEFLT